jgi:hypothetical protein
MLQICHNDFRRLPVDFSCFSALTSALGSAATPPTRLAHYSKGSSGKAFIILKKSEAASV